MGQTTLESVQSQFLQGLQGSFPRLVHGHSQIQGAKSHVIEHRGVEELVFRVLQDHADLAAQGAKFLFPAHRFAMEKDLAALRAHEPHDDMEKGGLAAAVGAVKPNFLSLGKGEVHVM